MEFEKLKDIIVDVMGCNPDVVAHMCRILKVRMSERPAVPITEVPLMMVPSLILPMTAESHWNLYAEPDR